MPEPGAHWIDYVPVDALVPNPANPKHHDEHLLDDSLGRFGYAESVSIDERTGMLSAGHGRRDMVLRAKAAFDAGEDGASIPDGIVVDEDGNWTVPVERGWSSKDDDEAWAYLVASNQSTITGGYNDDALRLGLEALALSEQGFVGTGFSQADLDALAILDDASEAAAPPGPSLADRFLIPPFSVFDARQGYWQDRKRQWLALGIRSEEGRARNLLKMSDTILERQAPNRSVPASNSGNDPSYYWKKQEAEKAAGRDLTIAEFEADWYEPDAYVGGTSIFDPVLCEIAYRWWCPPAGRILDPFAGGSVRGIVAAKLGRQYNGVDLAADQVAANETQADEILTGERSLVSWTVGDSTSVLAARHDEVDFVFSCPPYYDLERYSEDPADLSNASGYPEFLDKYRQIIAAAIAQLRPNRFACFVVGDIRDPRGAYRGFVPDTIRAFEDAGASFYNDIVLITSVGSLALRAARIFSGGRKVGKAHQNVLVFCKGDPAQAAAACGDLDVADLAEMFGEVLADTPENPADAVHEPAEPAWAKGIPVARLKAVSALYAAHDGPIPLGAFTAMKDNGVAELAAAGRLSVWAHNDEPVAALSAQPVTRTRRWETFDGATIAIEAGVLVGRLACADGYEAFLAEQIAALGDDLWLELWQEQPTQRAIARHLGASYLGSKIRASSEIVGLFHTGDSPRSPSSPDGWALAMLDRRFDCEALAAEIDAASVGWADHYAVYNKRNSWQAVALRGYGGDPEFIIKPSEMSKKWKAENPERLELALADTPLFDTLPQARAVVDAIPGAKHRVRLMRLHPGHGELSRHADITDPDAGTAPGRLLRLHFPIHTNPDVIFSGWQPDGDRQAAHMGPGEVWWLDTRKPHTAVNDGTTERVHLVVDVESSPEVVAQITTPAPVVEAVEERPLNPAPAEAVPWPLV